jgi:hypothetical protein
MISYSTTLYSLTRLYWRRTPDPAPQAIPDDILGCLIAHTPVEYLAVSRGLHAAAAAQAMCERLMVDFFSGRKN